MGDSGASKSGSKQEEFVEDVKRQMGQTVTSYVSSPLEC